MNAGLLRRLSLPLLALALAITAWLGSHAAQVGIEHDNASLRTTDPEITRSAASFRELFGSDEDILVALGSANILERESLRLLADLTDRISAIDGVKAAWSLTNVEEIVKGENGAEPRRLLADPRSPTQARDTDARNAAALARNPDFRGWLVSEDGRAAGIVVEIEDRPGDTEYRNRIVEELRGLAGEARRRGGELHLTGVPVQKIDVSAYVDRDQKILLPAAVVVLGFVLALFFRHLAGIAVPLAVAGITVAWTIGAYALSGHRTNAITALLPPVLLVIALATTVHVYVAWLEGPPDPREHAPQNGGLRGHERALRATRAVVLPGLLCAITTSQGFLSLSFNDLPAVRQFGFFAAFGTVVAFVVAMTVVPAALGWLEPPRHRASDEHGWMRRFLDASSRIATQHPGAVLAGFVVVTLVFVSGIPRLRANTDLVAFLQKDAPLRVDTEWIDAHLTGTLPLDFVIRRRDGNPIESVGELRRLDALEAKIRTREHVAGATSIVALVKQVHRAESDGTTLALPADDETLQQELDLLDESGHSLVRRFAAPGMEALRLSVRLHSVGSAVSAPIVAGIRSEAAELLGPDLSLEPTGSLWEVVRDSENLVRQQVQSFGSAIVLVVAAIGLLLRSLKFTIVAMIPNVVPILWTGGLMGHAGIELSTGTAMIASAVLGLIVDDTIHYLSYYRRVYAGDAVAAIRETSRAVGAPVTVSSTSLVLGFWAGMLGSFLPTIYFSMLTGLTMITGVFCDLLVLPASLVLLDRLRRRDLKSTAASDS